MGAEISKGLEAGTNLVASKIIRRQGDGRAVSEGKVVGGEVTGGQGPDPRKPQG